jgi:hypothetical protein
MEHYYYNLVKLIKDRLWKEEKERKDKNYLIITTIETIRTAPCLRKGISRSVSSSGITMIK